MKTLRPWSLCPARPTGEAPRNAGKNAAPGGCPKTSSALPFSLRCTAKGAEERDSAGAALFSFGDGGCDEIGRKFFDEKSLLWGGEEN